MARRIFKQLTQLLVGVLFWNLGAGYAWAIRDFSPHTGYLAAVEKERLAEYKDLPFVQPPSPTGPSLREKIFNEKLNREFRERYEQKFGRTEVERQFSDPGRYTYYDSLFGFRGTPQQKYDEQRRFAEYMVRRLTEYHFDNYAKSDPSVRPIYEAKERLSNVRIEVAEWRFDMEYQLAGNTFDMKVKNPYFATSRLRIQMDPGAFGPGSVDETIVTIGRPITDRMSAETNYHFSDGIFSLVGFRALRPNLGASLTFSTFTKGVGRSGSIRQSLYLAGLSYSF